MIQIQIATTLHEDGVRDIRWVLLDPSEGEIATPPGPARGDAPSAAISSANPAAASAETQSATSSAKPITPAAADPALGNSADHDGRPAARTFQLLRAIVLAAALAGAWWMASAALEQRSSVPKNSLVTSAQGK